MEKRLWRYRGPRGEAGFAWRLGPAGGREQVLAGRAFAPGALLRFGHGEARVVCCAPGRRPGEFLIGLAPADADAA